MNNNEDKSKKLANLGNSASIFAAIWAVFVFFIQPFISIIQPSESIKEEGTNEDIDDIGDNSLEDKHDGVLIDTDVGAINDQDYIDLPLTKIEVVEELSDSNYEIKNTCMDANKTEFNQCIIYSSNAVSTSLMTEYKYHETPIYKLNKKYKSLEGVFSINDFKPLPMNTKSDASIEIVIYGDDILLFNGFLNYGDDPIYVNIDVTNVDRLKVMIPVYEECFVVYSAIFANAILKK